MAGLDAFRAVYDDPLDVSGRSTPLEALVDRARMLQAALGGVRAEIDERFRAPGRRAFGFRLSGRHVGPLVTPLGELAPTGREISWAGMDIFLVDEDAERVTGAWAISDLLAPLVDTDAVTFQ